jgi:hypothetical protein
MARERPRPLRVETLEGKLLLSTVHAARPAAVGPPMVHGQPLSLAGTMVASAYQVLPAKSMARPVKISLAGSVASMGRVTATLTEQIDEQVEAVAHGDLVLQGARGSLTLNFDHVDVLQNLTTPYNSGFIVTYTVTSGTGAYAGATGSGTLLVRPDIGDFDLRVGLA